MTPKAPTRRSNAELAQDALAKARLYRARAREEDRRAAADFGLWVRALAARGDADATELCTRWDARATARGKAKPGRDAARPAKVVQNWPVAGLELVSGQVRELVRQGRRLEARDLIVKAENSTGIPLVPATLRSKWGLGPRAGEVVGPLT
ncbi:MAG: hypothetical protein ACK5SX_02690 [Sandaracinobacter sp.]